MISIRRTAPVTVGIGLFTLLALSACTNVCEKYAEKVDACLVEFCEQNPANPLCAEDARNNGPEDFEDCPSEQRAVYELLLEKSCEQLAREMGWEALNTLPP